LRRRGIRSVAYFHTDHFEPWRPVPGRSGGFETGIGDIEKYVSAMADLDFARRATLFFKPNVSYTLSADRPLMRAHPDDLLGFLPREEPERRIGEAMMAPIAAGSDHEIQVHIHHEYFTYNGRGPGFEAHEYLQTPHGRSFDADRLELAVKLTLETIRRDAGIDLAQWFFVHGNWALNASDPKDCTIVREIEILRRNGCLGDFTQPAGRLHVDSRIDVPFLVDPVAAPKGYDTPAANPVEARGAGPEAARRFFIWASATTHASCSIDTYSSAVQRRLKSPKATALEHARRGVVVDGVLYLKTHGHSLHPSYWIPDAARPIPHTDPGVRAELGALFDAADQAGADVVFLSVSEAYRRIIGAPAADKRDLTRDYRLRDGSAMDGIGYTVQFQSEAGALAQPPPLAQWSTRLPAATTVPAQPEVETSGASDDRTPRAVAHIIPLPAPSGRDDDMDASLATESLIDSAAMLSRSMATPEVRTINAVARDIALQRAAAMGTEMSGVTGFYGPRAEQRTLLQPSEVLCAAFVESRLDGVAGVFEIGCGLGLLTLLLSTRGIRAVGIERNGARLETAKAIGEAVAAQIPMERPPRWVKGVFPKVLRREKGLAASVALVTNLLGSATPPQQQEFIEGLRAFGGVLIDVQRFYTRRSNAAEFAELLKVFGAAGFDPPRLAFELGQDGKFVWLGNPRPVRRAGLTALWSALGLARSEPPKLAS
jgi:hypothetical protein